MRRTKHKSAYSKATLDAIRKEANRLFPGQDSPLCHIRPRCYCVAKPMPGMAVFVVPPVDQEPQVTGDPSEIVYAERATVLGGKKSPSKVYNVERGDWATLAYVSQPGSYRTEVIFVHKQKGKT